ncbi:DUF397 domain-containing protein [Nocardia thailandica]|uniref:DUF397 domain-containing protein n=1 Tax=Nocardia thailandica TaxID=257275 RepID=A0ABW6PG97_9NOCA
MATTASRVPADRGWFTSSYSNNGNQCVEVRFDGDVVLIRDSKFRRTPAAEGVPEPVVAVRAELWTSFLHCLLTGRPHPELATAPTPDGGTLLRHGGTTLRFTAAEWAAFVAGVRDDEFVCA